MRLDSEREGLSIVRLCSERERERGDDHCEAVQSERHCEQ
jgi:hypothetical protein